MRLTVEQRQPVRRVDGKPVSGLLPALGGGRHGVFDRLQLPGVPHQRPLDARLGARPAGSPMRSAMPVWPALSRGRDENGRCRMHGGKSSGAPKGQRNGRYRHGRWTIERQTLWPGPAISGGRLMHRSSCSAHRKIER